MTRKKDNVDLICDIAERIGLFERSSSLDNVLQTVVEIVAWHMRTAVCSIYLVDEDRGDLVLRATQGLRADAVGRVRLDIGEGITGLAVKEMRPIYVGRGIKSSHYKRIPDIEEEKYEAILGVPIVLGLTRIGALVVQDTQPDYFDDNDAKALKAIAAQLAATIENARLLIGLREAKSGSHASAPLPAGRKVIRGTAAARGVAAGSVTLVGSPFENILDRFRAQPIREAADFEKALLGTETQLEALQADMEERYADIASLIFSAHLLILKDPGFSGEIRPRIASGTRPSQAVVEVVNHYVRLFEGSSSSRLREKVQDVKDLGHRLLQHLFGQEDAPADYTGEVVVAHDLLPSDIVKLTAQKAEGIVLLGSGVTAHITILARSLKLPMMVAERSSESSFREGDRIIFDAQAGTIFVAPDEEVEKRYAPQLDRALVLPEESVKASTHTADGVRVHLLANINLLGDMENARRLQAEGIGLYRSEFPFIIRNDFPSEEEQYRIYRQVVEQMDGREITLRTLDTGGDKLLSYFPQVDEENPFLGLRAIRFSLQHMDIFVTQLRAMLRAGLGAKLRIMFPLVASVDDFIDARTATLECLEQLQKEGIPCCSQPSLGVMIELPSAVEVAPELAGEADFFCIGTNDLTQYMLAVDRGNERVSHLYREHHPAVLRALKRVMDAAVAAGKDVSICGEMLQDRKMLPFLLGIGLRKFSVNPEGLPALQRSVEALRLDDAVRAAHHLLGLGRIDRVEAYLDGQPAAEP